MTERENVSMERWDPIHRVPKKATCACAYFRLARIALLHGMYPVEIKLLPSLHGRPDRVIPCPAPPSRA